jgi:hypothetical protein
MRGFVLPMVLGIDLVLVSSWLVDTGFQVRTSRMGNRSFPISAQDRISGSLG